MQCGTTIQIEKPYWCMACPKTFVQKSCMKVHIYKYTGHKPFLCIECVESFTTKVASEVTKGSVHGLNYKNMNI